MSSERVAVAAKPSPASAPAPKRFSPEAPQFSAQLWRSCDCDGSEDDCDECKMSTVLRRKSLGTAASPTAPASVRETLQSPGSALDAGTRQFMESRFGHDFSRVRIHSDARAAGSARDVAASAYAVGSHVVFGTSQFAPHTDSGRRLLAHELAHVVHQRSGSSSLPQNLTVGSHSDPAERSADRAADAALSGSGNAPDVVGAASESAPVVRRQQAHDAPLADPQLLPTTSATATASDPQRVGDSRMVTLPTETRGEDTVIPHVIRTLTACSLESRSSSAASVDTDPDNLAIAFTWCRGRGGIRIFARSRSDLQSAIGSLTTPTGTVQVGATGGFPVGDGGVTVSGGGTATNQGGAGVGAFAGVTIEGSGRNWSATLSAQYLRRVGSSAPSDPNDWTIGGETHIGPFTGGAGANRSGGKWSPRIWIGGELDPQPEHFFCYSCNCPKHYECIDFIPDRDVPVTVPTTAVKEYRYYFKLDRTDPAEDPGLRAASNDALSRLATDVGAGGQIQYITAYASPEATEAHNQKLATDRANALGALVQSHVPAGTPVPQPYGSYELVGREPTPQLSSHLRDLVAEHLNMRAEDLSPILAGREIANRDLSREFLGLFRDMTDRAERLELFGLTDGDTAVQDDLIRAIDDFVRRGGAGSRPWEQVFRRMRFGYVQLLMHGTAVEMQRQQGSVETETGARCDARAAVAESMVPGFGPIDPSVQSGCKSNTSSTDDSGATAPSYAPTQVWHSQE